MKLLIAPAHHYINNYSGSEYTRSYEFIEQVAKNKSISGDVIVGFSEIKSMGKMTIHNVYKSKPKYISSFRRFIFPFLVYSKAKKLMKNTKYDCIWHLGPFAINKSFSLLALLNKNNTKFVIGPIYTPFKTKKNNALTLINDRSSGRNKKVSIVRLIDYAFYRNYSNIFRVLSDQTLKLSNKVLVFEKAGEKIIKEKGINNIEIVHLGVAHAKFASRPKTLKKGKIKLLTVSYLLERKRVSDVVRAMKLIVKDMGFKNIELTIVGDGPMWAKITALIKKYKLMNYINLAGHIPRTRIHNYYKNADIFVSGTIIDTMPAMYFEAMSAVLPMVIAENDSAIELKNDNFGGYVVKGKSPKDMATAIMKIIKNGKIYKNFSKQNYLLSKTSYNFNKSINQIIKILKSNENK